jgi:predicted amidohydrolase YtcJ
VTRLEAIESYTALAAQATGDEGAIGDLQPGMAAEYQLMSESEWERLGAEQGRSAVRL